ncbi:Gfo/Idh/MocA family protein [Deinococcus peraridilitoris]|uniref:Putative dehydrogenase n=1 Tax=Deinococcus peraridilitoris (strain DSM 19664 / LMG 22246 / CIP 109416 / KR-200) TaxID=937777 RepID=K9ZXW4_DEIPD|nr:Gfo/Idh/MocA family oxidoreductase [Deinococcus peraridilitoris]AFZ65757.1 putative dehydrogenase [Deinococcus peraridilitoris DSM 19664]
MGLRWGVLGAARIAQKLIPAIAQAGGQVTAVASRDRPRGQAFATTYGIGRVVSYEELLADPEIDAVYNPLPNDLHLPWSISALQAGKHVLCEKPMTLSAEQAAELARVAAHANRVVFEAFAYQFAPVMAEAVRLVRSGAIGEVRSCRGTFSFVLPEGEDFRWQPAHGGGALFDIGCYPVHLTRLMLGEPLAVSAQGRWTSSNVDIALHGTLRYAQALASFQCSFDEVHHEAFEVVGTAGRLTLDGHLFSNVGEVRLRLNEQEQLFPYENAYARMVSHVQELVTRSLEDQRTSAAAAVAQGRVIDALLQSAREQRAVRL